MWGCKPRSAFRWPSVASLNLSTAFCTARNCSRRRSNAGSTVFFATCTFCFTCWCGTVTTVHVCVSRARQHSTNRKQQLVERVHRVCVSPKKKKARKQTRRKNAHTESHAHALPFPFPSTHTTPLSTSAREHDTAAHTRTRNHTFCRFVHHPHPIITNVPCFQNTMTSQLTSSALRKCYVLQ